jgi:hypothetical protein
MDRTDDKEPVGNGDALADQEPSEPPAAATSVGQGSDRRSALCIPAQPSTSSDPGGTKPSDGNGAVEQDPSPVTAGGEVGEVADGEEAGDRESAGGRQPLLASEQRDRLSHQWFDIQTGFVDRPQQSVEQADALVEAAMQQIIATFADDRDRLKAQWESGGEASTEDLRVALTRYRSFFERLISR